MTHTPHRRITILHGFSRRNAGDGLLVDLTYELLAAAGADPSECRLLALDAASFQERHDVVQVPGEPSAQLTTKVFGAATEVLRSFGGFGEMESISRHSDALVAVGGGYLVADSLIRQAGVMLNHLAQLRAAARHSGPTVYLPQSIGPLKGVCGPLTRSQLARIDRVWVRDDETMRELALPNLRRCPDLAVMKLAQILPRRTALCSSGPVLLVGRALPAGSDYIARLRALERILPEAVWAAQADVAGPRSDIAFYRREEFAYSGPLAQHLRAPGGPVVSVRLHGAIASLIAGRPAIHLAYERKGWGAYQDLGLDDFVHDARAFDPQIVATQVQELARNPASYWQRISQARPMLIRSWKVLVDDLARRINQDVKR